MLQPTQGIGVISLFLQMPRFEEDIDWAVGGFNACDRCGSTIHTPFDDCPLEMDDNMCDGCGKKASTIYVHPELPVKVGGNVEVSAMLCYDCHNQAKNSKEYRAEWLKKND